MTGELDEVDQMFKDAVTEGLPRWRAPNNRNKNTTKSHYIVTQGMYAFKACRSVSNSGTFDLQKDPDLSKFPPCEKCQKQIKRFKAASNSV